MSFVPTTKTLRKTKTVNIPRIIKSTPDASNSDITNTPEDYTLSLNIMFTYESYIILYAHREMYSIEAKSATRVRIFILIYYSINQPINQTWQYPLGL